MVKVPTSQCHKALQWSDRGEHNIVHGVLLNLLRIVVQSGMRLQVLEKIDEGHQGIIKCREPAEYSVWWPGLSLHIQAMVDNCKV